MISDWEYADTAGSIREACELLRWRLVLVRLLRRRAR
jgi:hypothetical protein